MKNKMIAALIPLVILPKILKEIRKIFCDSYLRADYKERADILMENLKKFFNDFDNKSTLKDFIYQLYEKIHYGDSDYLKSHQSEFDELWTTKKQSIYESSYDIWHKIHKGDFLDIEKNLTITSLVEARYIDPYIINSLHNSYEKMVPLMADYYDILVDNCLNEFNIQRSQVDAFDAKIIDLGNEINEAGSRIKILNSHIHNLSALCQQNFFDFIEV